MFAKNKLSRINVRVIKKLLDPRPLYSPARSYSNEGYEDIFKCYSDEHWRPGYGEKYRPLTERDYDRFISKRAMKREPALTRQITTLAYKVGKQMISLAEGMPNESVFPFKRMQIELKNGGDIVLDEKDLNTALQYVPSQGLPALLSELHKFQEELHRPPSLPRDIIVTNGSQHGIYKCMELFVEDGDPVIISEYAYTGAHVALKPYHPEIVSIPEDEHGIIPETLESVLEDRLMRGLKMPKILYTVPTGSNPTGTVLPEGRRKQIYELACRYDFLIIEDDPYVFLNYSDSPVPSFLSLDSCGRVVRLDALSKVLAAGLRAGGGLGDGAAAAARAPRAARAGRAAAPLHALADDRAAAGGGPWRAARAGVGRARAVPAAAAARRAGARAAGGGARGGGGGAHARLDAAARRTVRVGAGARRPRRLQHGI